MGKNEADKALVLSLLRKLAEKGSWCGETHIQKNLYFLKEMMKVPTNYDFILYKHGPYSFDLHADITGMRANHYLELVPKIPYGPSITPGRFAGLMDKNYADEIQRHAEHVEFVAERLASKTVRELEALSTALYVLRKMGDSSDREVAQSILDLKPHISPEVAADALRSVKEMEREAAGLLADDNGG